MCLEIEKILRDGIKNSLRKWRSKRAKSVTTFHPEASTIMTDMLSYFELWKMHGRINTNGNDNIDENLLENNNEVNRQSNISATRVKLNSVGSMPYSVIRSIEEKITNRLKNILHSYIMRGFPINLPYTDMNTILTTIKLCCLHEIKHPDVLFILSVRCFPLYNGLFSLWIFLGTLEKERN